MLNSTVLEVAAGLIFTFLAISLATSALVEAIASGLKWRSRTLLAGVKALVNDSNFSGLAKGLYQYDHDPSLRAAVLFGHGDNFSRGIDVDAYQAFMANGRALFADKDIIDPLAKSSTKLTKPLIVVTHGDTWNMAHELDRKSVV